LISQEGNSFLTHNLYFVERKGYWAKAEGDAVVNAICGSKLGGLQGKSGFNKML
jgi:hypothetical protein